MERIDEMVRRSPVRILPPAVTWDLETPQTRAPFARPVAAAAR
jgi:hypothetical protein